MCERSVSAIALVTIANFIPWQSLISAATIYEVFIFALHQHWRTFTRLLLRSFCFYKQDIFKITQEIMYELL